MSENVGDSGNMGNLKAQYEEIASHTREAIIPAIDASMKLGQFLMKIANTAMQLQELKASAEELIESGGDLDEIDVQLQDFEGVGGRISRANDVATELGDAALSQGTNGILEDIGGFSAQIAKETLIALTGTLDRAEMFVNQAGGEVMRGVAFVHGVVEDGSPSLVERLTVIADIADDKGHRL